MIFAQRILTMMLWQRMQLPKGLIPRLKWLVIVLAFELIMIKPVAAIGSQPSADADRHLGAIKQALIDLSLGTELHLTSTAFVDERGALHESSMITSQSQVRGVRVLSYLQEAGIEVATLDATLVADDCPSPRPGLRRQARISVLSGYRDLPLGDHYISELEALSQQLLSGAIARTATWSASPAEHFSSSYHRKMSASAGSRPPFELQISLSQTEGDSKTQLDAKLKAELDAVETPKRINPLHWKLPTTLSFVDSGGWPKQPLAVELRLVDPLLGSVVLMEKSYLEYPKLEQGYNKTPLPREFIDKLGTIAQRFVGQMDSALECRRHYYHVINSHVTNSHVTNSQVPGRAADTSTSRGLRINAGTIAGVQIGDQFLLSPTPQITGQGADLADIEKLMLAEVQAVDAHGATLQVTAGQPVTVTGSSINHNFNHYVAIYF
jgi:hypothetical protein